MIGLPQADKPIVWEGLRPSTLLHDAFVRLLTPYPLDAFITGDKIGLPKAESLSSGKACDRLRYFMMPL
ncbi:hypothetical protein FDK21_16250 [Cohaesibacter sp. CAU 1516]|uniref:hypothetical protein n=1 Tax=Cohaesibacter sp. CAU 1516 TaxID=2576038 RepID=UPI0010FD341E|nr:hypothetical protein [Cohaesibacter sp. CAU 1516]TLP43776.1 hypothetical protein FDK21_16250 [Cohaesibacter sp. CAU 1516]